MPSLSPRSPNLSAYNWVPSDWGLLESRVLFPWVSTGLHMHEQTCRNHPQPQGQAERPRRWMGCVLEWVYLEASWVVLDKKHCPFHASGSGQASARATVMWVLLGSGTEWTYQDSSGPRPILPLTLVTGARTKDTPQLRPEDKASSQSKKQIKGLFISRNAVQNTYSANSPCPWDQHKPTSWQNCYQLVNGLPPALGP